MIVNNQDVFNLFDTNGRRNDIVNAIQTYLSILKDLNNEGVTAWNSLPDSTMQLEFYERALEQSPGVFTKHDPYDEFIDTVSMDEALKGALLHRDTDWLKQHRDDLQALFQRADNGIEDRARHYTSNLVKLGFATKRSRRITPAGDSLLESEKINRDELEQLLPIDNVNVIYLRQLLKLRIFDSECDRYYSPLNLAILALLKRERITEDDFLELVQGLDPSFDFNYIISYIEDYQKGDYILSKWHLEIPECIKSDMPLTKEVFLEYYRNRKSGETQETYWTYYSLLYKFRDNPSDQTLQDLLSFYYSNKSMINKAFGSGKSVFSTRKKDYPSVDEFLTENADVFETNLNVYLFSHFILSKNIDKTREYQDTTKRIFKATGIINFSNGFVELKYRELLAHIFDEQVLLRNISGNLEIELYDNYDGYENEEWSHLSAITTLKQILDFDECDVSNIIQNIKADFDCTSIEELSFITQEKRKLEFEQFIEKKYPIETVNHILSLFANRDNDKQIQDIVSPDASVPTIYEYIVGIAWYYFSGKTIDLLASFNLSLSANFEPLIHAGGGQGDIVIYEEDKIVMLEATLMNPNSQKRGEWEPVLRHSINLKTEEESNEDPRPVTTFFIADSFDYNTINIWKAVASVRLQSTIDRTKFTDNVVIMPVSNNELIQLLNKSDEYNDIIKKVQKVFEVDMSSFDINWREKVVSQIL